MKTTPPSPTPWSPRFARNVLLKALGLFVACNLLYALVEPLPTLGRLSAYNHLFPGRMRLPYGDDPSQSYNLSLFQLEALFASHEIHTASKPADEFRVLVIGDSSIWGYLLSPTDTLAARLTAAGYRLPDGRHLRAYNLGYPVMSLTKDLLILRRAMRYQPDLILWPLTLESMPLDKQLFPPLLQHNLEEVRDLASDYRLSLPFDPSVKQTASMWEKSIIGQRRALADLLRLQLYGIAWSATGIDHAIPDDYTPRMQDLPADETFHEFQPPDLPASSLAFDVITAAPQAAGAVPILIVNEPVFISQGEHSDIRYNFYYPRWAYDDYREQLSAHCLQSGWRCLDLWDAIDAEEFTNTAIHLTPRGVEQMAGLVLQEIAAMTTAPGAGQ